MSTIRFVGLDVHADSITVAVAETNGEVRSIGTIPNRLESVRKLIVKLGSAKQLRACYEAGPTGYVLYWQLTALGVDCQVIAPALVPSKVGDRVKTELNQHTSEVSVAGFCNAAALDAFAAGKLAGHQATVAHQLARVRKAAQGTHFRDNRNSGQFRHTT